MEDGTWGDVGAGKGPMIFPYYGEAAEWVERQPDLYLDGYWYPSWRVKISWGLQRFPEIIAASVRDLLVLIIEPD